MKVTTEIPCPACQNETLKLKLKKPGWFEFSLCRVTCPKCHTKMNIKFTLVKPKEKTKSSFQLKWDAQVIQLGPELAQLKLAEAALREANDSKTP